MSVHDVESIAPNVVLADEGWRKVDAGVAGEVESRVVVVVDVVFKVGGSFHENDVSSRDVARQLLYDGVL